MNGKLILDIKGLDLSFKTKKGMIHTLRGIDMSLHEGECIAIVGESGSGKSTAIKTIVGLMDSNAVINSGTVEILMEEDGKEEMVDLLKKDERYIRKYINGKKVSYVFQDPMTSLDPLMKVGKQIAETLEWNMGMEKKAAMKRAVELLDEVGIDNSSQVVNMYPHQLSGGMRQRVVIAIAIACNPQIMICDEPTTALDVTTQKKILKLIRSLQKERNLAVIFITHNLGVVANIADYVYVMYAGKIVEKGTDRDIFYDPRHPYTKCLFAAVPSLETDSERLYAIPGTPPNLLYEVTGDAFAPRNPYALKIDFRLEPPFFKINDTHYAASWLESENAPEPKMPEEVEERMEKIREMYKGYIDEQQQ